MTDEPLSVAGAAPRPADPAAEAAARAHVRETVRRAGSSFLSAMRMLPARRRQAVYAIYAFCREVDDIADEDGEAADKLARLAEWRREVARIYGGAPETAIGIALAVDARRFRLPREEFLRLIDAVELDAGTAVHAPTLAALSDYCRGVAGAVGLLLVRVFGAEGSSADGFAVALGEALQLTNILRDLAEDAERGRLYLPAELLSRQGVDPARPAPEVLSDPRVAGACAALAALAEARFAEADRLLPRAHRRALRPALAMRDVYRHLLRRLMRRGWGNLDRPVRVRALAKLSIALRHALF